MEIKEKDIIDIDEKTSKRLMAFVPKDYATQNYDRSIIHAQSDGIILHVLKAIGMRQTAKIYKEVINNSWYA